MRAWADAAGWMAEGRDLLNALPKPEQNEAERTLDMMTANRLAKKKFESAVKSLPREADFEPESIAAGALRTYRAVIEQLIEMVDRLFQLGEKGLSAKNMQELAPLMSEGCGTLSGCG